ncbi:hypothetical protein FRX31_008508 [Thalictrum thalictroides]|uniref:Uncharacterized protein n=1 Tax=Thalictrum thalictroides TaxID=46969 RepID=A0A7J6WWU5_THATH|nr:hypothetical protein FRX31_008508 [Thalictrum thalictroides]
MALGEVAQKYENENFVDDSESETEVHSSDHMSDDDGLESIRQEKYHVHIVDDDVIPENLPHSWIDQKGDIDVNFEEFDENVDYDSPTDKEKADEEFLRKKKARFQTLIRRVIT